MIAQHSKFVPHAACSFAYARARIGVRVLSAVMFASALIASTRSGSAQSDTGPPEGFAHSLQILSPGPTGTSTHNQLTGEEPYTVHIADAAAEVRPGPLTVRGIARGMKNVAVVCPAGGPWYMATPSGDGSFSVEISIPEDQGPLPVDVFSWDSPADDANYKININSRFHLFVTGARKAPQPNPAADMKLVWEDDFQGPLSVSSSRHRDATWFVGGKPSASGHQYSDAFFVDAGEVRNPFTIKDGFLRIRAAYDQDLKDPNGWNRKWWSGHLSTGFPDESASVEFREGYAEARMMTPLGAGAWPAFWLLDSHSTLPSEKYGAVEIDVAEAYGHDQSWYMATEHQWKAPGLGFERYQKSEKAQKISGHANAFHTYGIRLTKTEVTWYLDGSEIHRAPLFRAEAVSPFFLMLNLSMGGGWPVKVPPSGYYDLWIDYVRVYQ